MSTNIINHDMLYDSKYMSTSHIPYVAKNGSQLFGMMVFGAPIIMLKRSSTKFGLVTLLSENHKI